MQLTDDLIAGTINSISGFIVAKYAEDFNIPLDQAMESFLNSNTYNLLVDKETGFYFDSIPELLDMFLKEIHSHLP